MPCATTWTNLENIMLSEISQTRRTRLHNHMHVCMESSHNHKRREQNGVCRGAGGGGRKRQMLFSGCRVSIMGNGCSRDLWYNTVLTLNRTTLHTQTQVDSTSQVICFSPHWKKHPTYFSSRKTGLRCNFHESSR